MIGGDARPRESQRRRAGMRDPTGAIPVSACMHDCRQIFGCREQVPRRSRHGIDSECRPAPRRRCRWGEADGRRRTLQRQAAHAGQERCSSLEPRCEMRAHRVATAEGQCLRRGREGRHPRVRRADVAGAQVERWHPLLGGSRQLAVKAYRMLRTRHGARCDHRHARRPRLDPHGGCYYSRSSLGPSPTP